MAETSVIVYCVNHRYKPDSFDRFGDDLAEVIMSFLAFEDQIRLECLSKQWRALVFNKRTALIVNDWDEKNGHKVRQLTVDAINDSLWKQKVVSERLGCLLKKCSNMKSIEFSEVNIDDAVLDVISDCCPRLESIGLSVNYITISGITRFVQSLGQRLKAIELKEYFPRSQRKNGYHIAQNILLGFSLNLNTLIADDLILFLTKGMNPLTNLKRMELACQYMHASFFYHINKSAPYLQVLHLFALRLGDADLVTNDV